MQTIRGSQVHVSFMIWKQGHWWWNCVGAQLKDGSPVLTWIAGQISLTQPMLSANLEECLYDSGLIGLQYRASQYNTIQYNTIQYNTIQYNTIQYNTIQYNTNFRKKNGKWVQFSILILLISTLPLHIWVNYYHCFFDSMKPVEW